MDKRKEVKQLAADDVVRVELSILVRTTEPARNNDDGWSALKVQPVRCGPNCGAVCGCNYSTFESLSEPIAIVMKSSRRLPLVANLGEILAERADLESRISVLSASFDLENSANHDEQSNGE